MRKFAIGLAAIAGLIGTPALAADMAVKAPPPSPAPVYSWTGCYLGANGGYAWNNGKSSYRDPNTSADPINGFGPATIPTPTDTGGNSWTGGGEVGCNWQVDPRAVLGVEADIDALRASRSAATVGPAGSYSTGGPPQPFTTLPPTATEQVTVNWLSTIRARAGLPVLADRGLLFVTGGLAMGRVSSSGSVYTSYQTAPIGPYDVWAGSSSSTRTGYTIGGGFEYALSEHWTAKTEYLYYDLGNVSHPLNVIISNQGPGSYPTLGSTISSVRGSIIRVGLNYQFTLGPGH
jgi:outer membrane immunogenic protein